MDVPARVVSGLTASAKALFVAAAAHATPARRRAVRRAERRRPRAGRAPTCRSSSARSKGCRRRPPSARSCRSRRTRSIRTAAWRRTSASTSARARALHAVAHGTARVVVASAAALLPRVSAPERLLAASLDLQTRPGHRADRSRRAARRRRLHPRGSGRRARRVRRPRRHRRHLSGRRNATRPPRVHRRHDRDAAHLRPGDAAIDRADRSDRRSCRCATCCRTNRGATRLRLPLRAPRTRASSSPKRTRSTRTRPSCSRASSTATRRRVEPRRSGTRRRRPSCSRTATLVESRLVAGDAARASSASTTTRRPLRSDARDPDAPIDRRRAVTSAASRRSR